MAVIGAGVGEQHARAYARLPGCRLRWIHDLAPDRASGVVRAVGQGAVADRLETVLNDPAVDVVSIASFDDAHYAQLLAVLGAGKHAFVEKPLCRSLEELRAVKAAWMAGRRHLGSNLVLRAAPLYQALRRLIADGELGMLYAIDGDYLYGRLHKITEGWRKDVEDYSVMQGGGVHLVDLMMWLTGQKPVSVSTTGSRLCTAGTAFRYDDYMAATFRFASGLIGRITANFGCVHPHQHVLRLFGTQGTAIYDDQGARLYTSRDPSAAPRRIEALPLPASKGELIPAFIDGILARADTGAATQHEFDVISACLAADQAVSAVTPVEVEYV